MTVISFIPMNGINVQPIKSGFGQRENGCEGLFTNDGNWWIDDAEPVASSQYSACLAGHSQTDNVCRDNDHYAAEA